MENFSEKFHDITRIDFSIDKYFSTPNCLHLEKLLTPNCLHLEKPLIFIINNDLNKT